MRGFSTLELLMAFAILASALLASATLAYGAPLMLQQAYDDLEKAEDISSALEHDELVSRTAYAAIDPLIHAGSSDALFDSFRTDLTRAADAPCEPFVSGDWTHPRIVNSYMLAPGALLPASVPGGLYPVSALTVTDDVLAVAVGTTTHAADPTLFFFRITDTAPSYISSSFDNASASRVGFTSLASGGGYIYAGNGFGSASAATCAIDSNTCAQLQIFSVSANTAARIASLQVPATTASGAAAPADAIAYQNGFAYVGLSKAATGSEFQIIDVHDPHQPIRIGGSAIGHGVQAIAPYGNMTYLATDDNSSSGNAIVEVNAQGGVAASQHFAGAGYARALARVGAYLFIGRSYANGTSEEFPILDASSTTSLPRIGGADIGTAFAHRGISALIVRDFLAFLLTEDQLQVWNVLKPAQPQLYGTLALPHGTATALACRQNTLYIGSVDAAGAGYLTVVTSS